MMRAGRRACRALLFVSLAVTFAHAATAQSRDPAAADVLFRDGRAALKVGDFATACSKFAESQRLDPAPGTLVNLATCEEHLGRIASAWEHSRQAVDLFGASGDDRLGKAREQFAALDRRVPKLAIRLATVAPKGTRITRDGVDLAAVLLGYAEPVDPGDHVVVVLSPGRVERTYALRTTEGEQRELLVFVGDPIAPTVGALASPAAGTPSPSDGREQAHPAPAPGSGRRAAMFVSGGVGVAGLATAVVATVMLLQTASEKATACPNHACPTPDALNWSSQLAARGENLSTIGTVATGVGLVGVGVALYLLFTTTSASPVSTEVAPWLRADGTGVSFGSRF
jgi:hypothetical protein